jgi:hypothetical protein
MRFHWEVSEKKIKSKEVIFGSVLKGMMYKNRRPSYVTIAYQELSGSEEYRKKYIAMVAKALDKPTLFNIYIGQRYD